MRGKGKLAAYSPDSHDGRESRTCKGPIWFRAIGSNHFLHEVHQLGGERSRAEQVTLIISDPYNAGVEVGRDFALFSSEADLVYVAGTLVESVLNL